MTLPPHFPVTLIADDSAKQRCRLEDSRFSAQLRHAEPGCISLRRQFLPKSPSFRAIGFLP